MAIYDASAKLNAIHTTASNAYQTAIPLATASNILDVGTAVLSAPVTVMNEFYDGIVNLVGLQLMDTVRFKNPLSDLKKGKMPYGMTIEDMFMEMARPILHVAGTRNGDVAPDQFAIIKQELKAAFYSTVLERDYGKTLHQSDIERAFTSADPVAKLTSMVIQSLLVGEQYDDYRMTVGLIARQLEAAAAAPKWHGEVHLLTDYNALFGKALTAANALYDQAFLAYMAEQMQTWSNRLTFPRSDLNIAGVENTCPKESQHIIMLSDISAKVRTHLHAWAYNADKLQLGSVREIDAWYSIGADDTVPPVVTADAITIKADYGMGGASPCIGIIYDPLMVKIYNKVNITENARNTRGHYTNIWHTVADMFAASPFHNFVAFMLK